ncbi:Alpha/beta hydrolase fold-1 [Elsinoe ampelina]|uniref:Alpha/beta hydrolase fold-1 n=1 Tax=Elsinoe ampelina TaxID=302913 RepID=A0A6A6GR01_9PEZI|nr:Alpha/beta hydrolase fold-1 [Elsinoe ampelina]
MSGINPQNTAMLLSHGAWHAPHHYSQLIEGLEKEGYTVVAPQLPSVGRDGDAWDDDVNTLRSELQNIFKSGKDAAIIMHSYGGVCGSEAAKGFVKGEGGNTHGVVKLIYMCAFALPTSTSLNGALSGLPPLDWIDPTPSGKALTCERNDDIFYNDISDAAWKKQTSSELKPHAADTMAAEVTWEPYRQISSAYLLCERDMAIPIQAQEGMAEAAGITEVRRIDASHSPWVSRTGETVRAVLDAFAGKL